MQYPKSYDVIVIGGGHAGTEAALAAARMGRTAYGSAADVVPVPHVPRPLHHVLMGLCRIDERLLRSRNLPFGSSVLVAAHRPV